MQYEKHRKLNRVFLLTEEIWSPELIPFDIVLS